MKKPSRHRKWWRLTACRVGALDQRHSKNTDTHTNIDTNIIRSRSHYNIRKLMITKTQTKQVS